MAGRRVLSYREKITLKIQQQDILVPNYCGIGIFTTLHSFHLQTLFFVDML